MPSTALISSDSAAAFAAEMRSRSAPGRALQSLKSGSLDSRQVIAGKQRVDIGDQLFNVRFVGARHPVDAVAVYGVGQAG